MRLNYFRWVVLLAKLKPKKALPNFVMTMRVVVNFVPPLRRVLIVGGRDRRVVLLGAGDRDRALAVDVVVVDDAFDVVFAIVDRNPL